MDTQEYVWGVVSEECHEIAMAANRLGQLASKINRFGPVAVDPTTHLRFDNVEEVVKEANDLIAMIEMIGELELPGIDVCKLNNREMIEKKKAKVRAFMKHSTNLGRLQE